MDERDIGHVVEYRKPGSDRRGWKCPDETQIAAYADGRLAGNRQKELEDHLADCNFCLGQVGFLLRASEEEFPAGVPDELVRRARDLAAGKEKMKLHPGLRWGAVAAACAAVFVVGSLWLERMDSTSVERSETPQTVRTSGEPNALPELIVPEEGSTVGGEGVEFRWEAVPGSLFYELSVVTDEGDLVWEGRSETPRAVLPDHVRLGRGRRYFVWVRSYMPEGKYLKSRTVGFRTEAIP